MKEVDSLLAELGASEQAAHPVSDDCWITHVDIYSGRGTLYVPLVS